ncbi:unnamed protein product [Malus baccata var. baccata]|uniref:Uncharacterized protein n=1 Tax=Malus domestica TaxID=3750 RepID=A0A498K768_MALDO|nr:hypothetical protein DVH24_038364 [Malus domestica]
MEKGPRYRAYAELRESRLGRKHMIPEEPEEPRIEIDPIEETNPADQFAKRVFRSRSIGAQFLRCVAKREPQAAVEASVDAGDDTPAKSLAKAAHWVLSNSRGSKSASAGEKTMAEGSWRGRATRVRRS